MSERQTRDADGGDGPTGFRIPDAPAYRPPVALVGVALWALALASIAAVAPFAVSAVAGEARVGSAATVARAFAGAAAFAVLFPLFAHLRLRVAG